MIIEWANKFIIDLILCPLYDHRMGINSLLKVNLTCKSVILALLPAYMRLKIRR